MKLHKLETIVERKEIHDIILDDGFWLPYVSHTVVSDEGRIYGAISDDFADDFNFLFMWFRKKGSTPIATFRMYRLVEKYWKEEKGKENIVLTTSQDSIFNKYLKRFGFQIVHNFQLISKEIK